MEGITGGPAWPSPAGRPTAGVTVPVLEALAQNVEITGDRASAARSFVAAAEGSVAQVVEQLHSTRERRGITRWVVQGAGPGHGRTGPRCAAETPSPDTAGQDGSEHPHPDQVSAGIDDGQHVLTQMPSTRLVDRARGAALPDVGTSAAAVGFGRFWNTPPPRTTTPEGWARGMFRTGVRNRCVADRASVEFWNSASSWVSL